MKKRVCGIVILLLLFLTSCAEVNLNENFSEDEEKGNVKVEANSHGIAIDTGKGRLEVTEEGIDVDTEIADIEITTEGVDIDVDY